MRFKAKILDLTLFISTFLPNFIAIFFIYFLDLVKAIEKIGEPSCLMLLTPKKIQFILISDLTDGFQVWAACNAVSHCSFALSV